MNPTASAAGLQETLAWRYATKRFDPSRRIGDADWSALKESLRLAPSSFGLQPWRFVEVRDPQLRTRLKEASWNQSQVTDASHFVVLAADTELDVRAVDRYLDSIAATRGVGLESLAGLRQSLVGGVLNGPRAAQLRPWAERQVYIALGFVLFAAASLRIDACPMEGLDSAAYDRLLGLEQGPFRTVAAVALGYRSVEDPIAGLAKVRFPESEVFLAR